MAAYHAVSSGSVAGGDHRAAHARGAGRARLRDAVNSWLEETSFRAALIASATAVLLIGAAVAFALLVSGPGTGGALRAVPGAARGDPASTATPPASASSSSPPPRATAVPSASPAPPSPAASPAAPVTTPAAARLLPGCRHGRGHGRHRHC
jgi:hypothetical protein